MSEICRKWLSQFVRNSIRFVYRINSNTGLFVLRKIGSSIGSLRIRNRGCSEKIQTMFVRLCLFHSIYGFLGEVIKFKSNFRFFLKSIGLHWNCSVNKYDSIYVRTSIFYYYYVLFTFSLFFFLIIDLNSCRFLFQSFRTSAELDQDY